MDLSEYVECALETIQLIALLPPAMKRLVAIAAEIFAIEEAVGEGRVTSAKAKRRVLERLGQLKIAADESQQLLFEAKDFQTGASLPPPNTVISKATAGATAPAEMLKRVVESQKALVECAAGLAASLVQNATIGLKNQSGRKRGQRSQQEAHDNQARIWQGRADEIWASNPKLSKRSVASLLVKMYPTYGDESKPKLSKVDSIRRLIKRPR